MKPQHIAFEGEVMLDSWNDNSSRGATIKLTLADANDLDKFRLMTQRKGKQSGQRLMVVMVEIGEDENPVVQENSKPKGGELAKLAGIWCNDPKFQLWLGVKDKEQARKVILGACLINSRSELDNDDYASEVFHNRFRVPYSNYLINNP